MGEKTEVIKHSAAIQIKNNITLLQRRAWNVLLANAYDELPNDAIKEHHIPVRDLMQILKFDSNNLDYLKDALTALRNCSIEWNILGKDKDEWKSTGLLAEVGIEKDHTSQTYTCTYAYGPSLRMRLYNPKMYARLNLRIQNEFESKYALALWEVCIDYYDVSRGTGQTPFIPLETFRELMGVRDGEYTEFKRLSLRVVKEPLEEIQRVTGWHVTTEYQRQKRKVTAIKFHIHKTDQAREASRKQGFLFPGIEDNPLVYALINAGLPADDAWAVWQKGFDGVDPDKRPQDSDWETYLQEKIDLLRRRKAVGKVTSSTGFLLKAIKENYRNAEFAEAEAQQAQARQVNARNERRQEQKKLREDREQLERKRDEARHALCTQLIEADPSLAGQAAEALLAEDTIFRQQYRTEIDPAENYRARPYLWIKIDKYLEAQHPEHFAPLRERYDARLADIDARLHTPEQAA